MNARDRRLATAALAVGVITGLKAGMTTAPLANLAVGLAYGIPVGVAVWAVLTVTHRAMGGAR